LENILDSALVSSDVLYASYIQDTRGIDTALPCKLVCESSAQKKTACGLSAGRHSSGAEIAALRRNEVQALQLLRVRFYIAIYEKIRDRVQSYSTEEHHSTSSKAFIILKELLIVQFCCVYTF
jgi:hypothetical protein